MSPYWTSLDGRHVNATLFKPVATCPACRFAWKPKGDGTTEKCPSCGKRREVIWKSQGGEGAP